MVGKSTFLNCSTQLITKSKVKNILELCYGWLNGDAKSMFKLHNKINYLGFHQVSALFHGCVMGWEEDEAEPPLQSHLKSSATCGLCKDTQFIYSPYRLILVMQLA